MEKEIITKEILKIQSDLTMSASGMAKSMGISENTFNKKRSEKELRHWFNEQNLIDLKLFLKNYTKKLK